MWLTNTFLAVSVLCPETTFLQYYVTSLLGHHSNVKQEAAMFEHRGMKVRSEQDPEKDDETLLTVLSIKDVKKQL